MYILRSIRMWWRKWASGLVLISKSYAAHFELQVQLRTGAVVRDYLVLGHGWVRRRHVTARPWSRLGLDQV